MPTRCLVGEIMPWYTLFVRTGYEHYVMNQISTAWQVDGLNPFVPMYGARFKKGGRIISEKKRCAPGYVFIESAMRGIEFYISVKPYVYLSQNSFKVLRYGNSNLDQSFEMKEGEQVILEKLLNDERCVEMSKGLFEGESVSVIEGPLVGMEGLIKRVNRHKMEAIVEFEMMSAKREILVGLEIIGRLS